MVTKKPKRSFSLIILWTLLHTSILWSIGSTLAFSQFSLFEQQALKQIVQQWITAGSTIGGAGHTVHNEGGAALTQRAGLNCVGAGILCQDNGGYTEINVPGGTSTFADILAGTSKGQAMVVGDGSTLAATGTGTITATSSATATALAADPANCAAGTLPRGVTAAGVGDGCAKADLTTEVTGVLPIANGGTAGATAAAALTALGANSVATQQSGVPHLCSSATASDTYTCTMTPTLTAYTTGMFVNFRATVTANTGAATLAIDGLTAIPIVRYENSALSDNDILVGTFYTLYYDGTSFRLPRIGVGLVTEADTLDTAFDRGKVINGATSFANAFRVTDSSGDGIAIYRDGTLGPTVTCIVSTVENNCDKVQRLNSGKKFSINNSAGAEKFTLTESTGALTNVTLNVESTGNTITTISYLTLPFASCIGATASNNWDDDATGDTAPTAACNDTGSTQRPTANFSGSARNSLVTTFPLPPDWTGNIDLVIRYVHTAAAPTGNVQWDVQTVCRAAGETWDAAFNAAQTITDAVAAQNTLNDATQNGLTTTGCAAGEDMTLKISRNGAADTNNDDAAALWARLLIRRAQ